MKCFLLGDERASPHTQRRTYNIQQYLAAHLPLSTRCTYSFIHLFILQFDTVLKISVNPASNGMCHVLGRSHAVHNLYLLYHSYIFLFNKASSLLFEIEVGFFFSVLMTRYAWRKKKKNR